VEAWGDNLTGQTKVPPGLTGVTAIAAGKGHNLVVTAGPPEKCTVDGTASSDDLHAARGQDRACGHQGDDAVFGGPGRDVVYGNRGDDVVVGGPGRDELLGGDGSDVLRARDGITGERLSAGHGDDRCRIDPGDSTRNCEQVVRD